MQMDSSNIDVITKMCKFCNKVKSRYTCPRCNASYCSSNCYKSSKHLRCSESFYKDWIITQLQDQQGSIDTKRKMLNALKRLENEEENANIDDEDDLEERLGSLDLSNIDESELWSHLTKEEKREFEQIIKSKEAERILPVWMPWWTIKEVRKLVEEVTEDPSMHVQDSSMHVQSQISIPSDIKPLSLLTSRIPAACIKYNLLNILYSYVYVARIYNGEHHDFPEEAVEAFLFLSPVLHTDMNFNDSGEAIQYCIQKLCTEKTQYSLCRDAAVSLIKDVSFILASVDELFPEKSVLYALVDTNDLFKKAKKSLKKYSSTKNEKIPKNEKITKGIKKLKYFMSWTVEYKTTLQHLITEVDVEYACAIENTLPEVKVERKKKPLIEEITVN